MLISRSVEEFLEFRRIGELYFNDPGFMGGLIDLVGARLELVIRGCNLAADRRIEVADGLHALNGAKGLVGGDSVADLGHVDVDNVAQGVLGVVGNANGADGAIKLDPFMLAV